MFDTKFTKKFYIQMSIKGIYFASFFSYWNSLLNPSCPGTQSKVTLDSQVSTILIILAKDIDSYLLFELSVNPLFFVSFA